MNNMLSYMFITVVLLLQVLGTTSLHCWKCIGENCHDNPENNYRATRTICMPHTSCMKVEYVYSNNQSLYYRSTVRTCSMGICQPVDEEQYNKCLKSNKKYYVNGCIRRYCCDDMHLCNTCVTNCLNHYYYFMPCVLIYLLTFYRT